MAPNYEEKLSQLEYAIIRIDTNIKWIMGIGGAVAVASGSAFMFLISQNANLSREIQSGEIAIHSKLDVLKADNDRILDAIREAEAQGTPSTGEPAPKSEKP